MKNRIAIIVTLFIVLGMWIIGLIIADQSHSKGDGYTWYQTTPEGDCEDGNFAVSNEGCAFVLMNGDGRNHRVYRSTDGGKHWIPAECGVDKCGIGRLEVNSSGTLVAETDRGIYRSKDNGASWSSANNKGLVILGRSEFSMDTKDRLYIVDDRGDRKVLFGSYDGGDSWKAINRSLPIAVNQIISDSKGILYSGINYRDFYRSPDGGVNWQQIRWPKEGQFNAIDSIAIDSRDHIFILAEYRYICYSADGGKTWKKVAMNDKNLRLRTMTVAASGEIAVGTNEGAYISKDNGLSWQHLDLSRRVFIAAYNPPVKYIKFDKMGRIYAFCCNYGIYCGIPNSIR